MSRCRESVKRYETLLKLKEAGIPTVVWLCPILPFLNDTPRNITGLIEYCADAGVKGVLNFGMGLTLREGNRAYFYEKLDAHFPGLSKNTGPNTATLTSAQALTMRA